MSAASELLEELHEGETVEAVVFGEYGWGSVIGTLGYGEPDPPPVPWELRGKILTWAEAEPLMQSWQFSGGFGAPDCYAVRIWTNERIFWVAEYDGSTRLDSGPRHPFEHMPSMS